MPPSRFHGISLCFILAAGGVIFLTSGTARAVFLSLLLLAYLIVFGLGVAVLRLNFFCPAVSRGKPGGMRVALTFDDGPDPGTTPAVLTALARDNVKAAFFCVGTKVREHPDLVRHIAAAGHIVGNHTYHHFWWTNFLQSRGLGEEIALTQTAIRETTGKSPAFFRPPMGLTNPHLPGVLRKHGLACIGWDVRAFDTTRDRERVVRTIAGTLRDGSIVLLHDSGKTPHAVAALVADVLASIRKQGFTVAPLDELVGRAPYREEENPSAPGSRQPLRERIAGAAWVHKALEKGPPADALRQRPSVLFLTGVVLIGISYTIGWPAVAFFSFLAVYLRRPELAALGPASYLVSHVVFLLGMAMIGPDGVKYGRLIVQWAVYKAAVTAHPRAAAGPRKPPGSQESA